MNKMNKLFAGFAAVAMLVSCSNDEPTVGPGNDGPTADGEVAYMTITIAAPETGAPSSKSSDFGDYVESDATEKEHAVSSVDFLFFNANGAFAFEIKADNTTFVPADGNGVNSGNGNVEYIGEKNVLILNGVRKNNYPEYVMTILNRPADFEAGQTITETAEKLTAFASNFPENGAAPFVMTTSSFVGEKKGENGGDRHDAQYMVTKLNTTDFMTTQAEALKNTEPVEIYVERLAAKVEVELGGVPEKIEGKNYYKLGQTLAGGNDNTENGDNISDVDLYVNVEGWRLNATATKSYMSKVLNTAWTDDNLFTGWNKPADWRSFWGQAWTYGSIPTGKLAYTTPKEIATEGNGFELANEKVQYCYENTNEPEYIFSEVDGGSFTQGTKKVGVESSRVTHVVLHTKIYQKDAAGNMVAPSLVQYRGVLFTEASYKALLLNSLKADGKLNFWRYVGSSTDPSTDVTTTSWKSITDADFEMAADKSEGHKLGQIKIVAKDLADGDKIYERVEVPASDTEGAEGYVPAHVEYKDITDTFVETINGLLAAVEAENPAVGSDTADAFYYIPVEHFAPKGTTVAAEGYYGVVRNHWYKMTINSFKKVGHLVFKPEEDETPVIPEGPEDPLYYVGAKINILSWKVVNQTVEDL